MPKPTSAADTHQSRSSSSRWTAIWPAAIERARPDAGRTRSAQSAPERARGCTRLERQSGQALEACKATSPQGDIIIATMLFMEDHIKAICRRWRPGATLRRHDRAACRRRDHAPDAHGQVRHGGEQKGPMALLKQLRGKPQAQDGKNASRGAKQMAMLRRLPKLLRFIPGTAQDVRAYFLTAAVLAGGLRREHRQHGAHPGRAATPRRPRENLRGRSRPRRRSSIPRSASIIRA
jgi:magnesium chelatase subunit H